MSSIVSLAPSPLGAEARLFLRDEELDAALELFVLADAALASAADAALAGHSSRLGRGHWRAAFLLKRRPGLGVQDLARLTGLSKQGASRVLRDLEAAGYVEKSAGDADARRRPARLTAEGTAFEDRVSERLRNVLTRAYRSGGLDAVGGAHRILAAVAGPRNAPRNPPPGTGS
ncbi:MAG TPA: MarR family transcriptional regulator [Caulobacteraceae bacterium]|nr:MarR family transcriptional regulator [Caulobacteraceae bacterium]